MDDRSFDSLTRQVAANGTRRGPLAMLAAPGVEAIAGQLSAEAKKHKGKKKCPPALDRCGPQVSTCTTILTVACGDDQSCIASSTACCSLLATCDAAGFFICLGSV
jgi:hypothetical protein